MVHPHTPARMHFVLVFMVIIIALVFLFTNSSFVGDSQVDSILQEDSALAGKGAGTLQYEICKNDLRDEARENVEYKRMPHELKKAFITEFMDRCIARKNRDDLLDRKSQKRDLNGKSEETSDEEIIGCSDSDGGLIYDVYGTVLLTNGGVYPDECQSITELVEYECPYGGSTSGIYGAVLYDCTQDGLECYQGKCSLALPDLILFDTELSLLGTVFVINTSLIPYGSNLIYPYNTSPIPPIQFTTGSERLVYEFDCSIVNQGGGDVSSTSSVSNTCTIRTDEHSLSTMESNDVISPLNLATAEEYLWEKFSNPQVSLILSSSSSSILLLYEIIEDLYYYGSSNLTAFYSIDEGFSIIESDEVNNYANQTFVLDIVNTGITFLEPECIIDDACNLGQFCNLTFGCQDYECNDTDGGIEYLIPGEVSANLGGVIKDSCANSTSLNERYCDTSNMDSTDKFSCATLGLTCQTIGGQGYCG